MNFMGTNIVVLVTKIICVYFPLNKEDKIPKAKTKQILLLAFSLILPHSCITKGN